MAYAGNRPSLRTRIVEAQARATYSIDQSHLAPRRKPSFSERYRGTEYETPTTVSVTREPLMSRGRSLVLVAGTAAVGMTGLLLTAALG
jgi:hypothetical protein